MRFYWKLLLHTIFSLFPWEAIWLEKKKPPSAPVPISLIKEEGGKKEKCLLLISTEGGRKRGFFPFFSPRSELDLANHLLLFPLFE